MPGAREGRVTAQTDPFGVAPEQIDAWRAATQPVVDQYLSQSGDLGKQILEAAEELRQ